ncbi:hypothetical protein Q2V04_26395, partial [Escherichia coli]|nr:hypothetical protein [Escherichia coli]MDO2738327.1 hypothetical protein [Escherichia coli]
VSISVILFNSRFRSYGAQGVLKKHPLCGAFLVFWGFKFLSMNFLIFPSETICFHIFIDKTLIMIEHQRMNVNDYHYQQKECTSE